MTTESSLPSYDRLFRDLDLRGADDTRSVCSPAAYLADLLQLLHDHFQNPALVQRRPAIEGIPLDAENTYTTLPYLDIVNEVLAASVGTSDAFETLRTERYPAALPFVLGEERVRVLLGHLGVDAAELYALFAEVVDADTTARLRLGLSVDDVDAIVTPYPGEVTDTDADDFRRANGLSAADLRAVLATAFVGGGSAGPTLDVDVCDRAVRFVRLARKTGLAFPDLDLMVRSCCAGRLDEVALRTVAALLAVGRGADLPVDVVCSLVAPLDTTGLNGTGTTSTLFDRVFNATRAASAPILVAAAPDPATNGRRVLACVGDILAPRNREFRWRVCRALGLTDADLSAIVERFRARSSRWGARPFDRTDTGADLSLLHRVSRLVTALDTSVSELFSVLDVLDADPSFPASLSFPVPVAHDPTIEDPYRMLDAAEIDSSVCLVQALFAIVPWMRTQGLTGAELAEIVGSSPAVDQPEVLRTLADAFDEVALAPEVFRSDRFGERTSEVVHDILVDVSDGVVSPRDARLLRVDPAAAQLAAHTALVEVGAVTEQDFVGLGLAERLATKVFANLVHQGVLGTDGILDELMLPPTGVGLVLATDFSGYRDALVARVQELEVGEAATAFYPSDLADLGLTDAEAAELYDNLIFHGYLDSAGQVLRPEIFAEADDPTVFVIDVDLDDIAPAVAALLRARVDDFRTEPLALDPAIFAPLGLGERLDDLLDSLRFNGYLDAEGVLTDKTTLAALELVDLNLALEFYPHRRRVLDAVQDWIAAARQERLTLTPDDFAEIADEAVAAQIMAQLDGTVLVANRVPDEMRPTFLDEAEPPDLGIAFPPGDQAVIAERIATILRESAPHRLDTAALADLGFDDTERADLVALLVANGDLTEELAVPHHRLDYFGTARNAVSFALPGLEDYATDVFFLLHDVAAELSAGITEIAAALTAHEERQLTTLFAVLQDALGVPAAAAEAIAAALAGSRTQALDLFVAPVLAAADAASDVDDPLAPTDPHLRVAFRRLRRFALLAGKLSLDATEIGVAFADQDLVGKFPEALMLPPGVDRIDALLESRDGHVYVFGEGGFWAYSSTTYALSDPRPRPLTELSGRLTPLARVDAAFTDAAGAEWIVGRRDDGTGLAFVRAAGSTRWTARSQVWGTVRNTFAAGTPDRARIDAAYVDADGRTYLFSGDQYVRYSGPGYTEVDEGYPRSVSEWWTSEGRQTPLPLGFRGALDAAFQGRDGRLHLFAGDRYLSVADGPTGSVVEAAVEDVWGRVRNTFDGAERIDAAYVAGATTCLVAGNQVVSYSDCIENDGVRVDDGFLRRIEAHLRDVPAEFEGGVEAAFIDAARVVHLFKDGKAASLNGGIGAVVPTAEKWGVLGPVLPSGTVDAGFVGLDGKTYLFSGDRYLRYSGADYSVVDIGYPRAIAGDWGGLRRVDASFVLDGVTYLFGLGGDLLTLPLEHAADLDAGRVSSALRQRLARQGLTLPDEPRVEGARPWRITTDSGVRLVLVPRATDIVVRCDEDVEAPFYVRYATRDYTKPDSDHPRPLTDDWWSLPAGGDPAIDSVDAVFTGRDNRTYLFSRNQYVVFDHRRRWWSAPRSLQSGWDSLPFGKIDAAFVGTDGKTYVFSGPQYVRYSSGDYTKIDDRYPAPIATFWGNVVNTIARTGRVDAALVVGEHTYLFSGDQYVRYTGTAYTRVDDGYPRALGALGDEPRFANLRAVLAGPVDAAFADRHNVYVFSGQSWHVASDAPYRTCELPAAAGCAFVEDGSVLVEEAGGWHHWSALEGATLDRTPVRPRTLRNVPPRFRTGLDAVLHGTDGTTYLFSGPSCYDTAVGRAYPFAEEWGRARNTIDQDNAVDAAFVGRDGRTYLFRGDQYVVYDGPLTGDITGGPRPVADWGGLTGVVLAYVEDGRTHLFEKPTGDGTLRHVAYSGVDYTTPDEGYPEAVDASFWQVPADRRPAGGAVPDAVLVSGGATVLVVGEQYLQRSGPTGVWSHPRPLTRIWRDLGPGPVRAAFTDRDGATHFFFDDEFTTHRDGVSAPRRPIRDVWARSRNNFRGPDGRVDAAVVHRGTTTYLFSGDQYARYSAPDYRFTDPGYPRTIAGNLRQEPPFAALPESFEDVVADRAAAGGPVVDAVVANPRTVYLFTGRTCHVASQAVSATYDIAALGRVRNVLADRGRVDAALVTDAHTFLFAGDQYVRYSGAALDVVDDGYPRTLEPSLAEEPDLPALPEGFRDGIDAAFRGSDRVTYLFSGAQFVGAGGTPEPIAGTWGRIRNAFTADGGSVVDAAFVAPGGELYAFRGGQYVRYRPGETATADEGYPRSIQDDWGNLPDDFEDAVDGAFVFEGRTYLSFEGTYVRYSDGYQAVDRTYPQPFRARFAETGDYRLSDVHTIARFAELAHAHPSVGGGLGAFLASGPITDPYARLADLLGWDAGEIRWLQRRRGFLPSAPGGADDDRLDLELVLRMGDGFRLADRLGAGPQRIYDDVWQRLVGPSPDVGAAAATLEELLAQDRGPAEWPALAGQIHDTLNVSIRDALVAAVLAKDPADGLRTSRDLFDRFLIDVDMGPEGRTSRVREAIAAVQLYLHRYLLDLERPTTRGDADGVRDEIRRWWEWMRTYRVWEANRKVFLHPENYLRPELRAANTPAFRALESDLLQGEITPASVQLAYKRYLDEYTEVSRLTIAGGYVYTDSGRDPDERSLILFGRTKTDPRRYYYRRASFRSGDTLSTSWEPWLEVGVAIDADTVHPTHAFDRVFVFWATVEAVRPDPAAGTVVTTDASGAHRAGPEQARARVKILYSFYNLAGEWVPAQELGASGPQNGALSGVTLSVRAPEPQPGALADDRGAIAVTCAWTVTPPVTDPTKPVTSTRSRAAFALYPELYALAQPVSGTDDAAPDPTAPVRAVFGAHERIGPGQVVPFSNPTAAPATHWFSVDHKGGSFLCRPAVDVAQRTVSVALAANGDRLPEWSRIDAAFELRDHTRYFFDNNARTFVAVPPTATTLDAEPERIADRWGRLPRPTPNPAVGQVDGVFVRGGQTFVVVGDRYLRYSSGHFDRPDAGYPRGTADNEDNLPRWDRIDAGFRGLDGIEYFFTRRPRPNQNRGNGDGNNDNDQGPPQGLYARGAAEEPRPLPDSWGLKSPVDAAVVDEVTVRTFVFAGEVYLRFSGRSYDRPDAGYPRRIADRDPADALPAVRADAPAVRAAYLVGRTLLVLDNARQWLTANWGDGIPLTLRADGTVAPYELVECAWFRDGYLYLVLTRPGRVGSGSPPVPHLRRFALDDGVPAEFPDDDYLVPIYPQPDAAFQRGRDLYLLSGGRYERVPAGRSVDGSPELVPVGDLWVDLSADTAAQVTGSLDAEDALYLFLPDRYLRYPKDVAVSRPFELAAMPREIVRLTSGTAAALNQLLLAGGVPALLSPQAQEIDETPRFRRDSDRDTPPTDTTVTVLADTVAPERLPASSHLDFESANGLYYWEIFFHAPLLIAQALNEAQRFDEARRWYSYVFDPTQPTAYWRFLPFLAVDVDALLARLGELRAAADALWPRNRTLGPLLNQVLDDLATVAPAFRTHARLSTAQEEALDRLASTAVASALAAHERAQERKPDTAPLRAALHDLQEAAGVVTGLRRQYHRTGDVGRLLQAYRDDPFDPHAIAELRPVAYRRAVVMAFIDNLLDWGDMLFRQHTAESVDEARMLYVLALDLLGAPPERLGTQLPFPHSFGSLEKAEAGNLDLLTAFLTGGGALTSGPGAIHASIASSYFHIPANSTFEGYRERVEDRLRKIRASLDILGIAAPIPLFEPPLDPMALVTAAAAGDVDTGALAGAAAAVPHYRFSTVFRRAQELVDKLRQSGTDLLNVLERRDAEELGLLQSRQEGVILGLTRGIKEAEVTIATERLEELRAARTGTVDRIAQFTKQIADGPSALQKEQVAMMTRGRDAHFASAGLKIAAAIAKAAPQVKVGPFILGFEIGGDEIGGALETAAEVSEGFGEAFSMAGELLGVQAEVERAAQEWAQQLATARSDLAQLEHQVAGAEQQLAVAQRELEIVGREIAHQEAVATFLKNKFGNAELYRWMAGRLAGLYFEAYHQAYEMARSAERAFRFERGMPDDEVATIRPTYWESRRGGLLAAETLSLDLERLGRAAFDGDSRGLEITKRVSLLELDPVAFLRLRSTGSCEFALTEALFDRDFPGHYRRQIRTITLTFTGTEGEPVPVNATLAQLGHKTALAPDPKAVKFLLAPQGQPPETVRSDWRPNQQIALSHVDDRTEGNGLHELRFDDERYLPFEGTGAVSTWRLRAAGRLADLVDLADVVVVIRYSADDGGEVFSAAVRGMLKPYAAARFVDVAAEFPDEWAQFSDSDDAELVLPFTTEMFPGMTGRDITGIYPTYDAARGAAQLVLGGERPVALDAGRMLPTPGLRVGTNGDAGWAFSVEGDKDALQNVGLVLTYKAGVA
jgi:hypothetical protein